MARQHRHHVPCHTRFVSETTCRPREGSGARLDVCKFILNLNKMDDRHFLLRRQAQCPKQRAPSPLLRHLQIASLP